MQPRVRQQLSQKNHLSTLTSVKREKPSRQPQAAILPSAKAAVAALLRRSSICCVSAALAPLSSSIASRFSSMTISRPTAAIANAVLGKEVDTDQTEKGDANTNADASTNATTDNAAVAAAAPAAPPLPTTTKTTPDTPAAPAEDAAAAASRALLRRGGGKNRLLPPPPTPDAPLLSVAPMMDWTDVHFRSLARLLSKKTWLYTEMVVDTTLLHNPDVGRFLEFPESQRPVVCQLGGSDPAKLAAAAAVAARYGYDEVNLNCGCPSDRVAGAGCFGASLMREPARVAEACRAMREAVRAVETRGEAGAAMREVGGWGGGGGGGRKGKRAEEEAGGPSPPSDPSPASPPSDSSYRPPRAIDVTVKCRLGVDDLDSYEALCEFVRVVSERGQVSHFVVHARKCHLQGLSPAQNRSVPPLRHGWVFALKRDFPHLRFSLNGGLESTAAARDALSHDFGSVAEAAAAAGEEGEAEEGGAAPAVTAPAAAAAANGGGGEEEGERAVAAAAAASSSHQPPSSPPPPPPPAFLLEGTMIGRAAYHSPWPVLAGADVELWGAAENGARSRREVLELYADYCDSAVANADAAARRGREAAGGASPGSGTRRRPSGRTLAAPLLGLFHGEPGGRRWRYEIDQALKPPAGAGRRTRKQGKKQKNKRQRKAAEGEQQHAGGGGGGKEEEREEEGEEEEEDVEDWGPSMRDVIAHASKAVPDHVLDAPPPSGERIDWLARAAARAAEVAAEAASRHAAKKRKGPLPAPVKPLMGMPPPPAAAVAAGAGAADASAAGAAAAATKAE